MTLLWSFGFALVVLALLCVGARAALLRALPVPAEDAVAIAVLGDSDSHSYGDRIWFPVGSEMRGGTARAVTLQWTEVLSRLRGARVDLGEWGSRGAPARVARVLGWFGLPLQTPRKEDFAFNFATSGARCEHLMSPLGQLVQLRRLIARDSAAWSKGAVVIRIGINDIGGAAVLDSVARGSSTASAQATELRDHCLSVIEQTVREIRAQSASVSIVLVGIADNTNWPPNLERWRSTEELARIRAFLSSFDLGLSTLAATTPRSAFLDDRAWFASTFGERAADGTANFRAACVGSLQVTYRQGNDLGSAILVDGHAGTMLNLLWIPALVDALQRAGVVGIAPIETQELVALGEQLAAGAGDAAPPRATACGAPIA